MSAHPLGSLAYDATAVALFLGRSASLDLIKKSLTSSRGFLGSAGLFRFRVDGIVERKYSIFEISDKGVSEISPATQNFP